MDLFRILISRTGKKVILREARETIALGKLIGACTVGNEEEIVKDIAHIIEARGHALQKSLMVSFVTGTKLYVVCYVGCKYMYAISLACLLLNCSILDFVFFIEKHVISWMRWLKVVFAYWCQASVK
ncbi:hypothetical protein V6N13_025986 [Hibiscus sabdariffa]